MTAHFEDAAADLRRQVAALERKLQAVASERDEALARQAATAEVLDVINASPQNLAAVFDAIVEKAIRLCEADFGGMWLLEDGRVLPAGGRNLPEVYLEYLNREPPPPSQVFGRAVRERPFIHIPDLIDTEAYRDGIPLTVRSVELGGIRTYLGVPLREDGSVVGVINLYRQKVRLFTDGQITLVQAFAAQALIAMKNARLFNESREALARQTATSQILRIISQSPTDARPVFERIVETAVQLLGCEMSAILLCEGANFRTVAAATREGLIADVGRTVVPIDPSANFPSRAIVEKKMLHLPDWSLIDLPEHERKVQALWDINSTLFLPLLREGACIGLLTLAGKRANIFGPGEIVQAESFRDQALIAIENARLFNETQEALEQQKASADVLSAIGKSVSDAEPVFEAILDAGERLFGTAQVGVFTVGDDDMVRVAAWRGSLAEETRHDVSPLAESVTGRLIRERRLHHIPDTGDAPDLAPRQRARAASVGGQSVLFAPMLWEDRGLGSIFIARSPPRPFSGREQALLQTFADQAAIAIENARLFNETQEALRQQTATSDILRVIASSPSDLQPVLDSLAETAARLCGAYDCAVLLREGDILRVSAHYGPVPLTVTTQQINRGWVPGRAVIDRKPIQVDDLEKSGAEYPAAAAISSRPGASRQGKLAWRAVLAMPLMHESEAVGAIVLRRIEALPFSESQIALLKTFSDQAVIAIENVRLFDEVQARTRDLTEALQQQTATADVLKVISRSAFDLQTVLDTLVRSAVELIGATHGSIHIREGGVFPHKASFGFNPEIRNFVKRTPISAGRETLAGRVALSRDVERINDVLADEELLPSIKALVQVRSMLGVPLLRDDRVEGMMILARNEAGEFTPRQVDLVRTFADQALIAIENVRLFDEVQARTRELQEALQQQTATADVLKVISRSAFDLQTVLDTLIRSASELSGSTHGAIWLKDGEVFRFAATFGNTPEFVDYLTRTPQRPGRGSVGARVLLHGSVENIADVAADEEFDKEIASRMSARSGLGVPLLRDGEVIGAFAFGRPRPGLYSNRDIELVQTFADQAVIAIENVRLFDEVQARTRDLTEALEHQTATSEVLSAISRSPTEVQPVFDAIARSATELCEATSGGVDRFDGDLIHLASHYNWSPEALEAMREIYPVAPGRGFASARAVLTRAVVHIPDITEDLEYTAAPVVRVGFRTVLAVPMLREGQPIGAIAVVRLEKRPFTDRQIALLQTFAEQAVIAVNNVRLFDEVQARTRDLTEALQQQTATADVLKVISRSAFDLQTVLDTLAASAAALIGANLAVINLKRDGGIGVEATFGATTEFREFLARTPQKPGRETCAGRVFMSGEVQNIADALADPEYNFGDAPQLGNVRALLGVPLFRDGKVEGSFTLGRHEPGAFTQRQIEIVQTFADQAVIAIENVRLFDEVQARTRDLSEALQQQTATADVLKAISRTAFDLDTVLDTLTSTAVRLCDAHFGEIFRCDGGVYRYAASHMDLNPAYREHEKMTEIRAGRGTLIGRVALENRSVEIADAWNDPEYMEKDEARLGNVRAMLGVPLMRGLEPIGAFALGRGAPIPFTKRQVELVQTFADQAVIAIENVRLFDEVQARTRDLSEALQQQTATADVLKVISRSAFDLQTVLDTLVRSAMELSNANSGVIYLQQGDAFHLKAHANLREEFTRYLQQHPQKPGRGSGGGRVLLTGEVQNIPDVQADEDYDPVLKATVQARALLGVPLLRNQAIVGAIMLTRNEVGAFTDRQIEIVRTFADQAVIATENARLFGEVQARTRELAASLDDLRKAQDRLIQSEKLASLGQLTAGIAHEIKNPLNFVNNFSTLSRELLDELRDTLDKAPLEKALAAETRDLIGMVASNLDKVVSHGKRADSIVKNMLLHSREGSGERSSANINAMVEEALNLAYHGARAEKPGFNVTIAKSLDPQAGSAEIYPQEMTRVLLNLISNGFYATTKRKQAQANGTYEPTITASTRDLGHSVEIAIRDNGTGIPDEVKAKMFNPFFTTKPAGEGTGLGLSLSHDIVVKQHGGTLEVATEPGVFTQFTIHLPRMAPADAGAAA